MMVDDIEGDALDAVLAAVAAGSAYAAGLLGTDPGADSGEGKIYNVALAE